MTTVRECRNPYLNILLDRVQLNGDLSVSAVAESRFDKAPFILGVPERINLTPDVDFD